MRQFRHSAKPRYGLLLVIFLITGISQIFGDAGDNIPNCPDSDGNYPYTDACGAPSCDPPGANDACCGGTIIDTSVKACCDDSSIAGAGQVCCDDGGSTTAVNQADCCGGVLLQADEECCGDESIAQAGQVCCDDNGTTTAMDEAECCGGFVLQSGQECCGSGPGAQPYTVGDEGCCADLSGGSAVVPRPSSCSDSYTFDESQCKWVIAHACGDIMTLDADCNIVPPAQPACTDSTWSEPDCAYVPNSAPPCIGASPALDSPDCWDTSGCCCSGKEWDEASGSCVPLPAPCEDMIWDDPSCSWVVDAVACSDERTYNCSDGWSDVPACGTNESWNWTDCRCEPSCDNAAIQPSDCGDCETYDSDDCDCKYDSSIPGCDNPPPPPPDDDCNLTSEDCALLDKVLDLSECACVDPCDQPTGPDRGVAEVAGHVVFKYLEFDDEATTFAGAVTEVVADPLKSGASGTDVIRFINGIYVPSEGDPVFTDPAILETAPSDAFSVNAKIITVNDPETRDLEGTVTLSLIEGSASDLSVFYRNQETGLYENYPIGTPLDVVATGHSGCGIHYWHGKDVPFKVVTKSEAPFKFGITVNPVQGSAAIPAKVEFKRVDLDVDSNNDQALQTPERTADEEAVEFPAELPAYDSTNPDPNMPGKVLYVNDGDADGDGVPDYADGMAFVDALADWSDDGARESGVVQSGALIPIVVQIPQTPSGLQGILKVKFVYGASDPLLMVREGTPSEGYSYALPNDGVDGAAPKLRLWKKDHTEIRDPRKLSASGGSGSGDFIPANTLYSLADLGMASGSETITLFVEALEPSETVAEEQISMEVVFDPDGTADSNSTPIAKDQVALTVLGMELVVVREGNVVAPLENLSINTPAPGVSLTNVDFLNLRTSTDNQSLLADLSVSGSVVSDIANLVPESGPQPDTAIVYVNGEEVGTISINVSKSEDPESLSSPFPYAGAFSGTLSEIPVTAGINDVSVTVVEPVVESAGFARASVEVEAISPLESSNPSAPSFVPTWTLAVDFDAPLSPSSADQITAIISHADGSSDQAILTETGDETLIFEEIKLNEDEEPYVAFRLRLETAPEFDPLEPDILGAELLLHEVFFLEEGTFALVESGIDTKTFSATQTRLGEDWELDGFADFALSVAGVTHTEQPPRASTTLYRIRVRGPEQLLDAAEGIQIQGQEYELARYEVATPPVAGGASGDGEATPASASAGGGVVFQYFVRGTRLQPTGLSFNPILIGFNRGSDGVSDDSALRDNLSFSGGFVVGFGKQGIQSVGDLLSMGWAIGKVGFRYQWQVAIFTDNAQYQRDLENVISAGEVTWELAKFLEELNQRSELSRNLIFMAIATGNMEAAQAAAMSSPQWELVTISIELFEGALEHYSGLEPYEKGKAMGAMTLEIVTLVPASWTKLGKLQKLSKLEDLLTALNGKIDSAILQRLERIIAPLRAGGRLEGVGVDLSRAYHVSVKGEYNLDSLDGLSPGQRFTALAKTRDKVAKVDSKIPHTEFLDLARAECREMFRQYSNGEVNLADIPMVDEWNALFKGPPQIYKHAGKNADLHIDVHHVVEIQFLKKLKPEWQHLTRAQADPMVPGFLLRWEDHAKKGNIAPELQKIANQYPIDPNPSQVTKMLGEMRDLYRDTNNTEMWIVARDWLRANGISGVPD